MITIKEIVLKEIGEGNIEPYDYNLRSIGGMYNAKFKTLDNDIYIVNVVVNGDNLLIDFNTLNSGFSETNKFEQYKVMGTISKIILEVVKKEPSIHKIAFAAEKVKSKQSKSGKDMIDNGSKRGNLYIAYIKNQLNKIGKSIKSIENIGNRYEIEF